MLVGAGYVIQQLGVGYATDMEHANPNKVAIVEAWGNLQKGLEGQGVLVFIGHGTRRRDIGPLCLLLAVPEEYVRNAEEYVCVADDLPRHISLDNDNEPLLSLAAICCHSGAPPPQVKSVVVIRSAFAAAVTQAHQNTSTCLSFSFAIVACHAAKGA